jgi:hypothetical protein
MSSITITTKNLKKGISAYFLSHPCKMIVVYLGIPQYLQRNAGVVPGKGHDSFFIQSFPVHWKDGITLNPHNAMYI